MNSTTMTIRVPTEVRNKLDRIAVGTRRSRSWLAAEAVAAYVDHELSIIEGIQQGLADVAAGRVVPHEVAMREVEEAIARVKAKRN